MTRSPATPFRVLPILLLAALAPARGDEPPPFLGFIRAQADALRADDAPPTSLDAWEARRASLRRDLNRALGRPAVEKVPLEPKSLGTLDRDGYKVEKLAFQTMPGIWMTANAYVPDRPGRHPAILAVHGHWAGAKQDPAVQSRCIGAAKLGYFVLAVDAFGAGERGIGKALGEYHGEMTAATLYPAGLTLAGVQAWENARAVDYLRTRPEVDPDHIGITGASGGGNQTMYAAALDDRLKAAAAVCSVGNYRAYLGAACCLCEVVPGALRFTDEGDVLGLVAPRALLVVNAREDSVQFSPPEAARSLERARLIYRLFDRDASLRHTLFDGGHAYSQPMREAVYGWMGRHLDGRPSSNPVPEPTIRTEDPESLRCYPGRTRPDDWTTLPQFAAELGRKQLASRPWPEDARAIRDELERRRTALEHILGGIPRSPRPKPIIETNPDGSRQIQFEPEPGIKLRARSEPGRTTKSPIAVVLDLDGAEAARKGEAATAVRDEGWGLVTLDLRATGAHALPSDRSRNAPDHNTAEWSLWIGRPLLGQWATDLVALLDALAATDAGLPKDVAVIGSGPAGLAALAAGAIEPRFTRVGASGMLTSFVADVPYRGQRLGTIVPGILGASGDVSDLAAMIAPRRLSIAGGVSAGSEPVSEPDLKTAYKAARSVYEGVAPAGMFRLTPSPSGRLAVEGLR